MKSIAKGVKSKLMKKLGSLEDMYGDADMLAQRKAFLAKLTQENKKLIDVKNKREAVKKETNEIT